MAITATARGTAARSTGASTTFTFSPASNFGAGVAVLAVAMDNSIADGTAQVTFTCADSIGNTWTRRVTGVRDPASGGDGVEYSIWETAQSSGTLTTGTVITLTFGTAVDAIAVTMTEMAGTGIAYSASGVGTGSSTASPTVTTSSLASGDGVVGVCFNERGSSQVVTYDSDTTNGSWATNQTSQTAASGAGGMTCVSQVKVTTGAGTQTYNPTFGTSTDTICGWISYAESGGGGPTIKTLAALGVG